jgi:hypothetical protein
VELAHNRSGSHCCGALSNACGHTGLAARQAIDRAEEGQAAGASALATACMSCAQLLGALQGMLPVHHYLEFLYDCPIDWAARPYGTVPRLFLDAEGNAVELGALLP